jgi:glutamate-1-semialdehyde aminotransferase
VIVRSKSLWARAKQLIPGGTQTLAKGPGQHVQGVAPIYVARGRGARVWDVDGNEYLDMTMAVGPLSLGYADPVIDEAIRMQLADGITFSLMHPLEVEVAELIRETVPNVQSVRFSKTGADATSAAVRVARAFTDRERVACCGYHGWHDWYIAHRDRSAGIPSATRDLTSIFGNKLDTVRGVIDRNTPRADPRADGGRAPAAGFLGGVRACDEHGAPLVSESATGLLAPGGAQRSLACAPTSTFSAIATRMPCGAGAPTSCRARARRLLHHARRRGVGRRRPPPPSPSCAAAGAETLAARGAPARRLRRISRRARHRLTRAPGWTPARWWCSTPARSIRSPSRTSAGADRRGVL